MAKLTDRELMGMGDLMNLGVEFADVVEKVDMNENPIKNHTIYSLLMEEYTGIRPREIAISNAKTKELQDAGKKAEIERDIRTSKEMIGKSPYEVDKVVKHAFDSHFKQLYCKELGEFADEKLGVFYEIDDNRERKYIYNNYEKFKKI